MPLFHPALAPVRFLTLVLTVASAPALLLGCNEEEPPAGAALPEDFLWGTASAAWQVEGDYDPDPNDAFPVRSNWTEWTERGCVAGGQTNPSGSGFYTRYADDFGLAQAIGTNAYRLTIDWARVEPTDDQWNEAAITHYVEVLQSARDHGLNPMVTFFHWVTPTFIQDGREDDPIDALTEPAGPQGRFAVEFEEFVRHVAPAVAPYADLYSILNEPFSVMGGGYLLGDCGAGAFPPGRSLPDLDAARFAFANLAFAHAAACATLRELDLDDADGDGKGALCGQAASNNVVRPLDPTNPVDIGGAERLDWIYNHAMSTALTAGNLDLDFDGAFSTSVTEDDDLPIDEGHYAELQDSLDWMGINYYGPVVVSGIEGSSIGGVPMFEVEDYNPSLPHSSLGFAIEAEGFGEILDDFGAYGLPIYITENGIGDSDDSHRPKFLMEHVEQVEAAVGRGVDVRGYFHWSLTDNFEWAHGFDKRFGLVHVDFEDPSFPRSPRPSYTAYGELIEAGGVTDALRETWASGRYPSDSRP